MKGDPSLKEYAGFLFCYLDRVSNLSVVLMDADLNILDCNRGFLRLLGERKKPVGKSLREYLSPEEGAAGPFTSALDVEATGDAYRPVDDIPAVKVHLMLGRSVIHTLTCYLFRDRDRLLLFGEKLTLSDSEILHKMSVLNNELAEMTRELNRKNRELEKANATITRLMNTDPLTGLANRRYFQEIFARTLPLAQRRGTPLALVMADLDHFKAINDRFGHDQGDQVLVAFARLLQTHSRAEDLVVRFGGEEFLVLLPETKPKEAVAFAERIRQALLELWFEPGPKEVSASFGVTGYVSGDTQETMIKRADTALYRGKQEGRNRVVLLEEAEERQAGAGDKL